MRRVWDWDRTCTVREVFDDITTDRKLAYTTVMTVFDNLFKKGLLTRTAIGRTYHYRGVTTREEHTAALMTSVLSQSGNRPASLLRFVEHLTPAEQRSLRATLNILTPDGDLNDQSEHTDQSTEQG